MFPTELLHIEKIGLGIHKPVNDEGKTVAVGSYLVPKLTKAAEDKGVQFVMETAATELVVTDGKVTGVKAGDTTYTGKAVILATGGFAANTEMVLKYKPDYKGFVCTNAPGMTGDGIVMATAIGADTVDMEQIQIHPTVSQETSALITEGLRGDGAILVNSEGKRFFDEVGTRDAVSAAEVAQPGGFAWLIVDNKMVEASSAVSYTHLRVGRSDRIAYAYLMVRPRKQVNEIAQKRLQAIKEFTELGSGYKIAMRDLTIRGAGDLLGPSQSGFIDTVGIDMYIEMLQEAIAEKKGEVKPEVKEPVRAQVQVDGYIPKQFAPLDFEKISLYQRIDATADEAQLMALKEETQDYFGKMPKSVGLLFEKKRLDILLNEPRIDSFRDVKNQMEIVFSKAFSDHIDGVKLFETFTTISKDIQLRYVQGKIIVRLPKKGNELALAIEVLDQSKKLEVS